MIIYKCDRCEKMGPCSEKGSRITAPPPDWYLLKFGSYPAQVQFHLCPECRKILLIPDTAPEKSIGENLITLIEDIAIDAAEEAISNA